MHCEQPEQPPESHKVDHGTQRDAPAQESAHESVGGGGGGGGDWGCGGEGGAPSTPPVIACDERDEALSSDGSTQPWTVESVIARWTSIAYRGPCIGLRYDEARVQGCVERRRYIINMVRGKHARHARVAVDSLRFEQLEARRVVSCGDGRAQTLVLLSSCVCGKLFCAARGRGEGLVSAHRTALSLPLALSRGGVVRESRTAGSRAFAFDGRFVHTLQSNESCCTQFFNKLALPVVRGKVKRAKNAAFDR